MRDIVIVFVHLIVTVVRLAPGRPPFRRGRVGARQTSAADPRSRPKACSQPPDCGSYHRRLVYLFHAPGARSPFRHRAEAVHPAASPPRVDQTKVPPVVFLRTWAPARSKRTG